MLEYETWRIFPHSPAGNLQGPSWHLFCNPGVLQLVRGAQLKVQLEKFHLRWTRKPTKHVLTGDLPSNFIVFNSIFSYLPHLDQFCNASWGDSKKERRQRSTAQLLVEGNLLFGIKNMPGDWIRDLKKMICLRMGHVFTIKTSRVTELSGMLKILDKIIPKFPIEQTVDYLMLILNFCWDAFEIIHDQWLVNCFTLNTTQKVRDSQEGSGYW